MQPQTGPPAPTSWPVQPTAWANRNPAREQRWDTATIAKLTADDMIGLLESVLTETERDMDCQEGFRREGIDGQTHLDTLDDCKEMIVDVLEASGCAFAKLTMIKLNKALWGFHPAHAGTLVYCSSCAYAVLFGPF